MPGTQNKASGIKRFSELYDTILARWVKTGFDTGVLPEIDIPQGSIIQ